MAYFLQDQMIGHQAIESTSTTKNHPLGTIVRVEDATYGAGEAIYLLGVASTVAHDAVVYNPDDFSTNRCVADLKGPVAISLSANVASQYGWYLIQGKNYVKSATVVDNADVYASAVAGTLDDAVLAGCLIRDAKFASANGTPSTGYAEIEIARPYIDSAPEAAVADLTDNSGGATADGTIGAVTAPTAIAATLTDNTGDSGTHDDTLADGLTATTPAAITNYTAHTSGSTPVTSNAATDLDTTAAALATLENEVTALRATVAACVTDLTVQNQNDSDLAQKILELVTAQAANRAAIVALTDAVKELSTKQNALLAVLRTGQMLAS